MYSTSAVLHTQDTSLQDSPHAPNEQTADLFLVCSIAFGYGGQYTSEYDQSKKSKRRNRDLHYCSCRLLQMTHRYFTQQCRSFVVRFVRSDWMR